MGDHVKKFYGDWFEKIPERKKMIERHLQECDQCRIYYNKMNELLDPGLMSIIPRLKPDPFLPTRIDAILAKRRQAAKAIFSSRLRFAVEGFALVVATLVGIILGKTISPDSPPLKADEIIATYRSAVSPQDFTTELESVLYFSEGDRQ